MTVRTERIPVIMLAMVSLVTGVVAGLQRLGWGFAIAASGDHGGIMVGGFLGTLISFEKVIPLKNKAWFVVPILSGASVLFFFLHQPLPGMVCLTLGSVGLTVAFLLYWRKQRSWLYALMAAGALCWLTGNLLFCYTGFYRVALPWWMAFTLLIIAAERLELTLFLPVSPGKKRLFIAMLVFFIISCLFSFHGAGGLMAAAVLAGVSIWLIRYDVVGINLKKEGLVKYTGIALLSGYFALLMTAIIIPALASRPMGYDAIVHSFFIGFICTMIFAHGPIILPGILGIAEKPHHILLYFWLFLLHTSWAIRVVTDILLDFALRKYSGVMTAAAILGYFITLITITILKHRARAV